MNLTVSPKVIGRSRVALWGVRVLALAAAVAAAAAFAVQQGGSSRDDGRPAAVQIRAAKAFPGRLTAAERAAVTAALGSNDDRVRRLAASVAAGEAGALALGDPGILHHHGVDTAARRAAPASGAAERFHHR